MEKLTGYIRTITFDVSIILFVFSGVYYYLHSDGYKEMFVFACIAGFIYLLIRLYDFVNKKKNLKK